MKFLKILAYILTPVLIVILSTYLTISFLLKKDNTIVCPDLRGKSIEAAKQIVEKQGIEINVLRYEHRADVPYNHVTVQKPDANIPMRKGRVINVLLSQGPDMTKVPNLIGQSLEEAHETLDLHNLGIGRIVVVPHREPGKVILQIPAANEEIVEKNKVTLFVAIEPKRYYIMPSIRSEELTNTTSEMDTKKIRFRTTYAQSEFTVKPTSRSIGSSPLPRTIFSSDDEVVIQINYGG